MHPAEAPVDARLVVAVPASAAAVVAAAPVVAAAAVVVAAPVAAAAEVARAVAAAVLGAVVAARVPAQVAAPAVESVARCLVAEAVDHPPDPKRHPRDAQAAQVQVVSSWPVPRQQAVMLPALTGRRQVHAAASPVPDADHLPAALAAAEAELLPVEIAVAAARSAACLAPLAADWSPNGPARFCQAAAAQRLPCLAESPCWYARRKPHRCVEVRRAHHVGQAFQLLAARRA